MLKMKEVNLIDLIEAYGQENCEKILKSFECPLNKDVEDFIHNKAISFSNQKVAITYLVFSENMILVGYYTLANKFISIQDSQISKSLQKRISKFSQKDESLSRFLIPIPLIAQLGKNFSENAKKEFLKGDELLELACNRVQQAEKIIGGKMTYIECASNDKLFDFYSKHGFIKFGTRPKEKEELSESPELVQMLKYF